MEKNSTIISWEKKTFIINELSHAKEHLKQLEMHLDPSAITNGKLLITKILSSVEISLFMLNGIKPEGNVSDKPHQMTPITLTPITRTESPPCSVTGSPLSDYDSDLMADYSKKRKTLPRWTEKVRVSEQMGLEGPPDDGYSWRKYGQKDILNANYPRGYYRCTHRNVQGCLAMKQVQRIDGDPSTFNITYRGRHTCIQASHLQPGQQHKKHDQKQNKSKEAPINYQTSCHVKAENFGTTQEVVLGTSSFSFPSASTPIPCMEKENNNNIFCSLTPDNYFMGSLFASQFFSPTAYESNNLSTYGHTLQTSEYDVNELISAATLDMCSPFQDLDLDIPMEPIQSGSHYPIDISSFFV
ncbi:hypothetical protein C5167_047659 [Papaver somniferum]|uniref:WRKY domain-containing protein n=1 Tax=Papaver somniferum TaxID=3469 RepID=A0A4Y7LHB7_PAPSO|nr:probable WRKY transcription factor 41 [Papaver somniferum]RZC84884.1 hypothetical protein C5167_047659 [Papaver somniferum]